MCRTQRALSSPCFLPTVHNLLRPGDFYCIRCPLNFDAGNLCRKQPRPGGLGLQKPNRRHKETAYLSLADCIIACLDVWRRGRGTKFRGVASPLLMPLDYQTRSTKKALPVWTFVRLPLGVQYKKIDSVLGSRSFPYPPNQVVDESPHFLWTSAQKEPKIVDYRILRTGIPVRSLTQGLACLLLAAAFFMRPGREAEGNCAERAACTSGRCRNLSHVPAQSCNI